MFGCQLVDLVYGNAHVEQPLLADFNACAVFHRFFYIVAGNVYVKTVNPTAKLILTLGFKVWLTVEGEAHEPT